MQIRHYALLWLTSTVSITIYSQWLTDKKIKTNVRWSIKRKVIWNPKSKPINWLSESHYYSLSVKKASFFQILWSLRGEERGYGLRLRLLYDLSRFFHSRGKTSRNRPFGERFRGSFRLKNLEHKRSERWYEHLSEKCQI